MLSCLTESSCGNVNEKFSLNNCTSLRMECWLKGSSNWPSEGILSEKSEPNDQALKVHAIRELTISFSIVLVLLCVCAVLPRKFGFNYRSRVHRFHRCKVTGHHSGGIR